LFLRVISASCRALKNNTAVTFVIANNRNNNSQY
jgi:hypothetical protein